MMHLNNFSARIHKLTISSNLRLLDIFEWKACNPLLWVLSFFSVHKIIISFSYLENWIIKKIISKVLGQNTVPGWKARVFLTIIFKGTTICAGSLQTFYCILVTLLQCEKYFEIYFWLSLSSVKLAEVSSAKKSRPPRLTAIDVSICKR